MTKDPELQEPGERIDRLRKTLLPPERSRPVPPESPFQSCPRCSAELERGQVENHGTIWGVIAVGLSYTHLFFSRYETPKSKSIVLPFRDRRLALHCPGGETTIVLKEKPPKRDFL